MDQDCEAVLKDKKITPGCISGSDFFAYFIGMAVSDMISVTSV